MNTFSTAIRRECRVAFSRRAQPVWFRIVKWACILAGVALFHDRRWFWWTLAGLALAGCCVHFLYRCKTKTWTRAWGGWNDMDAGRG
ncbi:MAG TPA: hypothetical protein VFR76_09305 [Verrucomicrobiae bacterium]|nr:hypothetical protein [Verrucomicrobiae bacterium]